MRDVSAIDLRVRIEAGLVVIGVGLKEVHPVLVGVVELLLRDRRDRRGRGHRGRRVFDLLGVCYARRYECSDANRTEQ